jgi:hypothetical protein
MEGLVFREMLLNARPDLTEETKLLDFLQIDLLEVAEEIQTTDHAVAWRLWIKRLGGKQNVLSYARVLEAGHDRKG